MIPISMKSTALAPAAQDSQPVVAQVTQLKHAH